MIWTIQYAFTIGKSCLSNLIALWDEMMGFAGDGRHSRWYLLLLWQIPCFVIVVIHVVLFLGWLDYLMGWKNSKDGNYRDGRDLEQLPCEEGSWRTDWFRRTLQQPATACHKATKKMTGSLLFVMCGWKMEDSGPELKYKKFRVDRKNIFLIERVKQWIKLLVFQIPNCK